jgi:hypothetical protein
LNAAISVKGLKLPSPSQPTAPFPDPPGGETENLVLWFRQR